jgi:hypothetical protein
MPTRRTKQAKQEETAKATQQQVDQMETPSTEAKTSPKPASPFAASNETDEIVTNIPNAEIPLDPDLPSPEPEHFDESQDEDDQDGNFFSEDDDDDDEDDYEDDSTDNANEAFHPMTHYTKTTTRTVAVIAINLKANPLGLNLATRNSKICSVFAHPNGDSFRCNEPTNTFGVRIMSCTLESLRNSTDTTRNYRSPKPNLRRVLKALLDEMTLAHAAVDIPKGTFSNRLVTAFEVIMKGFNSPPDTARQLLGNIQLRRMGYIFASIRLGMRTYRRQVDEFGAAVAAIRIFFQKETKGKHHELKMWFTIAYHLLDEHGQAHAAFRLPKLPGPIEPVAEAHIEDDPHSVVCQVKNKPKKWWYAESRPKVKEDLLNYIKEYEAIESDHWPESMHVVPAPPTPAKKRKANDPPSVKKRRSLDALKGVPPPI